MTKQEKILGKCMRGKTFLFIMLKDFFKQKEQKNVEMIFIKFTKEEIQMHQKYMNGVQTH